MGAYAILGLASRSFISVFQRTDFRSAIRHMVFTGRIILFVFFFQAVLSKLRGDFKNVYTRRHFNSAFP